VLTRPIERLHDFARRIDELDLRARRAACNRLKLAHAQLATAGGRLEALSPLKVLERGYSVTKLIPSGAVVRSSDQARIGDQIETRLQGGRLTSRVEEVHEARS